MPDFLLGLITLAGCIVSKAHFVLDSALLKLTFKIRPLGCLQRKRMSNTKSTLQGEAEDILQQSQVLENHCCWQYLWFSKIRWLVEMCSSQSDNWGLESTREEQAKVWHWQFFLADFHHLFNLLSSKGDAGKCQINVTKSCQFTPQPSTHITSTDPKLHRLCTWSQGQPLKKT